MPSSSAAVATSTLVRPRLKPSRTSERLALDKAQAVAQSITHRDDLPGYILAADTIVVLDRGVVKETGSHDDLMARGGVYHALASGQGISGDRSGDRGLLLRSGTRGRDPVRVHWAGKGGSAGSEPVAVGGSGCTSGANR